MSEPTPVQGVFVSRFLNFQNSVDSIAQRFVPQAYATEFAQGSSDTLNCTFWGKKVREAKVVKGKQAEDPPVEDTASGMPMVVGQTQDTRVPLHINDFWEVTLDANTKETLLDTSDLSVEGFDKGETASIGHVLVQSVRSIRRYHIMCFGTVISTIEWPVRSPLGYLLLTPVQGASIIAELYKLQILIEWADSSDVIELATDKIKSLELESPPALEGDSGSNLETIRFGTTHVFIPPIFYIMRQVHINEKLADPNLVKQIHDQLSKSKDQHDFIYRGIGLKSTTHVPVNPQFVEELEDSWVYTVPASNVSSIAGFWISLPVEHGSAVKYLQFDTSKIHASVAKSENINVDAVDKIHFFMTFTSMLSLNNIMGAAMITLREGDKLYIYKNKSEQLNVKPDIILLQMRVFNIVNGAIKQVS
jgi:hypothetical protein